MNFRDLDTWIPRQISLSEGMHLSIESQLDWMTHGVNSGALYEHIRQEGSSYDAIFFAPYLFGTTFFGSLVLPEKSVLIPCLHDENYAYTDIMQCMFTSVRGCIFNSLPEQELAIALFGQIPGGEVGMGFESLPVAELPRFFQDDFPYILYVGRKETGKNVQMLIDYFISYKESRGEQTNLRLVIVGGGDFSDLNRPAALLRSDIIDLVHVSEIDKQRLIKHSAFLCQPSRNESFSIVIMEAWLAGVPVVVHAGCAVTRYHAVESGGGLYFSNEEDFRGVCERLEHSESLRHALAEAGRRYVTERYSWDSVLRRFDEVIERISSRRSASIEVSKND